ncbi:hypothetical protein VTL71DRAFT_1800 [Oculimacula yallundae]|uniref:Uncharacterized protein n=1 Tax=Oculimacula yallundae TaxID=86028 RepID=A0ABR4CC90_9HELO
MYYMLTRAGFPLSIHQNYPSNKPTPQPRSQNFTESENHSRFSQLYTANFSPHPCTPSSNHYFASAVVTNPKHRHDERHVSIAHHPKSSLYPKMNPLTMIRPIEW